MGEDKGAQIIMGNMAQQLGGTRVAEKLEGTKCLSSRGRAPKSCGCGWVGGWAIGVERVPNQLGRTHMPKR